VTVATTHKTTWRPLRVARYSDALEVTTVYVYGYRAECSCGWHGHLQDRAREARAEMRWHRDTAKED
jgi:hypothetical protein